MAAVPKVFATLGLISGYVAIAASSLLIVLRIIAIWNRKRVIVVIALVTWVANLSIVIYGVVELRSMWVPDLDTCSIAKSHGTLKLNFIFTLVTDIVLLSIMLLGLLRMRCHGSGSFALAHLLWKQGLIWLLLATLAEVPPVVFIILNLNEPFDVMFQLPALLTMSIAATRMHRALVDRASRPVEITKGPIGGNSVPKTEPEQTATVPMRFRQMEVAMNTVRDQHAAPQTRYESSCIDINMDGQWPSKPYELRLGLEDDLERGVENIR
ncbi:hypothetical protein BJV74DRAFT_887218 [Russula compacta]|nr:hypothetical protein BJV74DRAFT_887218 [Russula compacta]